jgi:hypothetical protein
VDIKFRKLVQPTADIAECMTRWENDPALIPFARPNRDQEALDAREVVTIEVLEQRLEHQHLYLIYLDDQLVGEMDYQIDPRHLYKKHAGTAWIGIVIGEEIARIPNFTFWQGKRWQDIRMEKYL